MCVGQWALALLLAVWGGAAPAQTGQQRLFYVPLPEQQIMQAFQDIGSGTQNPPVHSVFGMTISVSGTVIYWDQWEDGNYETNTHLFNPGSYAFGTFSCTTPDANAGANCTVGNTRGTQIWGDQDRTNGCPPIVRRRGGVGSTTNPCASDDDDFLNAGDVVITRNRVPIGGSSSSYTRTATDDCQLETQEGDVTLVDYCFDGRDKIGTTFPVEVSRLGWPTDPGTLLAGATEVVSTGAYADNVTGNDTWAAPVGEDNNPDTDNDSAMFSYTFLFVMAAEGGAQLNTDQGDSCDNVDITLDEGQGAVIGPVNTGYEYEVCSGSAQAHLITGDRDSTYEMRWYALPQTGRWSDAYVAPVATAGECTSVWLYNLNRSSDITVNRVTSAGTTAITVPPGDDDNEESTLVAGQPATFTAATAGDLFYALSTTDCDGGVVFDWGYPLIPRNLLTSVVQVGLAPGCSNESATICSDGGINGGAQASRSPVWITTDGLAATTVYVDYDGQGARCDTINPGVDVVGDAGAFPLAAGDLLAIVDDPDNAFGACSQTTNPPSAESGGSNGKECDFDMTGARIFTCDGTRIAAAWGQDPPRSGSGDDEGLDLGNAVTPFGSPDFSCEKFAETYDEKVFGGDPILNSAADEGERIIRYVITIDNNSTDPEINVAEADVVVLDQSTNTLPAPVSPGTPPTVGPSSNPDFVADPPPYCYTAPGPQLIAKTPAGCAACDDDDLFEPGETWVYECYAVANSNQTTLINNAAAVVIGARISAPCTETVRAVNFTFAGLTGFEAYNAGGTVVVEWRTGIEAQTLGFHLERLEPGTGEFVRLNSEMLPARAAEQGAVYRYRDTGAQPGAELTYRLLEVELNGGTRDLGTFVVTAENALVAPSPRGQIAEFESEDLPPSAAAAGRAKRARDAKAAWQESFGETTNGGPPTRNESRESLREWRRSLLETLDTWRGRQR